MLTIQFPDLIGSQDMKCNGTTITLHAKVPLLFCGPQDLRNLFFQNLSRLPASWIISQGEDVIPNKTIVSCMTVFTTDIILPQHLTLARLLSSYCDTSKDKWSVIFQDFSLDQKLSAYSYEQQLYFQTVLLLQQEVFLAVIKGGWNLLPKELLVKLKPLFQKQRQIPCYLIVEEGSELLIPTFERWDITEPFLQPTPSYLDETIALPHITKKKSRRSISVRKWDWKQSMVACIYSVIVVILLFLGIQLLLMGKTEITSIDRLLANMEEQQCYPISIVKLKSDSTIPVPFEEEQIKELEEMIDIPLHENKIGGFDIGQYYDQIYMMDGEKRINLKITNEDQSYRTMYNIQSIPQEAVAVMSNQNEEQQGIYVEKWIADAYGIKAGTTLHTFLNIPLSQRINKGAYMDQNGSEAETIFYTPEMEVVEVDVLVKEIIDSHSWSMLYGGSIYSEFYMDEALFQQYLEQVQSEKKDQIGTSYPEIGQLIPYHAESLLVFANSKQQKNDLIAQLNNHSSLVLMVNDSYEEMKAYKETLNMEQKQMKQIVQPYLQGGILLFICILVIYSRLIHRSFREEATFPWKRFAQSFAIHTILLFLLVIGFTFCASDGTLIGMAIGSIYSNNVNDLSQEAIMRLIAIMRFFEKLNISLQVMVLYGVGAMFLAILPRCYAGFSYYRKYRKQVIQ